MGEHAGCGYPVQVAAVEGDQDFTVALSVAFGEGLPRYSVTPDGDADPLWSRPGADGQPVADVIRLQWDVAGTCHERVQLLGPG